MSCTINCTFESTIFFLKITIHFVYGNRKTKLWLDHEELTQKLQVIEKSSFLKHIYEKVSIYHLIIFQIIDKIYKQYSKINFRSVSLDKHFICD